MAKQSVTLELLSYHASATLADAIRLSVSNNSLILSDGLEMEKEFKIITFNCGACPLRRELS